jgi:vesicle coat complex subunit
VPWVQVIVKLMEMMDQSSDFVGMLVKKLAPPLVTLLSAESEIQYVALRNINLVVQKRWSCVIFFHVIIYSVERFNHNTFVLHFAVYCQYIQIVYVKKKIFQSISF